MTLHDLGVLVSVPGRRAAAYGCYGLAALGTLVAAGALLSL
jgi:hypothetical protein